MGHNLSTPFKYTFLSTFFPTPFLHNFHVNSTALFKSNFYVHFLYTIFATLFQYVMLSTPILD